MFPPFAPESAPYVAFGLGVTGSLAAEALLYVRAHERGQIPRRYLTWGFWTGRAFLSAIGGVLAWAYYAYTPGLPPILYLHVGAATPAILLNFADHRPGAAD